MKSWSFTKLLNFEKCPHMVTFPYRAADNEHTLRGTEVHNTIEQAIKNKTPCEYDGKFPIQQVAVLPNYTEPKWGFTKNWRFVGSDIEGRWVLIKPDLVYYLGDTAVVVDYKTGKKDGNELKHRQQLQLYAIAAALIAGEEIEFVRLELWYIDLSEIVVVAPQLSRGAVLNKADRWKERALKLTEATEFPAKPNKSNCRFCWENDRCEFAVVE
jgi:CRISPR/Cas system-associated exonuclease Cas4 (RecB family)